MSSPSRQLESDGRLRELTRGWPPVVPSLTIVGGLLLGAGVPLVTTLPVLPVLAFALLIAWRLYRPDMVAPWAGLPLGIVADILTGQPVGVSATVWPLALLELAIIDPRFPLRDQRMDWALAAAPIILGNLITYNMLAMVNLPRSTERRVGKEWIT